MTLCDSPHPQLLRWEPVDRGELMRLIYVDEAGTSPAENMRVVASVIVHGDNDLRALTSEIERINRERVPEQMMSDDYIFHAKEVFNGGKRIDRKKWPFEDRLDYLKEIICLPFVHDMPIALGICAKGHWDKYYDDIFWSRLASKGFQKHMFEHGMAFSDCLVNSDMFLRKYLNGSEIGVVIAEDVPYNKKFLSMMGMMYRGLSLELGPEHLSPTNQDIALGLQPEPRTHTITNIIDQPNYVPKEGAPLLQLADGCAFAFRRYLERQSHGEDLILAMLGPYVGKTFIEEPLWFSGGSSGLFNTQKYWSDEQRSHQAKLSNQLRFLASNGGLSPD